MTKFLYPRGGQGPVTLGGVVFTDGAAEAELGPHTTDYLEMIGATIVRSEEELNEHTVDELHDMARAGGFHAGSHLHKADLVQLLRGDGVTFASAEAREANDAAQQTPAGDAETPPTDQEPTPTGNAPETPTPDPTDADEKKQEDTGWQPSPPSTTSPTTTGSLSLQERRRQQSSPDASPEHPAES